MATLIDGRSLAAQIRADLKRENERFAAETGRAPRLAVVLVGNDPASEVYVRSKQRACAEIGFGSEVCRLPASASQRDLGALLDRLNRDEGTDAILVQLPLPPGLDELSALLGVDPAKDVDAFHPYNTGLLCAGAPNALAPCTPAGIMEMLCRYGVDCAGRECVVIGRSDIVGKPMAMLLLQADATVTVCHSRTRGLASVTRRADILVSEVGRAGFLTGDMVREGAVVIDVGMNRLPDGTLTGDADFASVEPKASLLTPVPGGVGPMTVAMLMRNTMALAKARRRSAG